MLADGAQERIPLQTKTGETGYRINKFQVITENPGQSTTELVVKIYKVEQSTATSTVDFSDNRLLGVSAYQQSADSFNSFTTVVFDNEIFNQDIYITCQDSQNQNGANYYIELEQMPLALDEATVATLKDIRNND